MPLVLIVDDIDDNRDLYAQSLPIYGFRVEVACSGWEALEKAAASEPDVIVMDLAMPRLNGFETTRRLKDHPVTAHIPVIALTGSTGDYGERDAREAGCISYLLKPCIPYQLAQEIRRVLQRSRPRVVRA